MKKKPTSIKKKFGKNLEYIGLTKKQRKILEKELAKNLKQSTN